MRNHLITDNWIKFIRLPKKLSIRKNDQIYNLSPNRCLGESPSLLLHPVTRGNTKTVI